MRRQELDHAIAGTALSESDLDRLERAELAIDLAKIELEGVSMECEDLHYLIEIVQLGVRRARHAAKDRGLNGVLPEPGQRPN